MFRSIKNYIIKNEFLFNLVPFVVNLPVFGNVYDFFYFMLIRYKVKNSRPILTIEPNNICNLRCIMCSYDKMTRPKETMPLDLFKQIIEQACSLGCKIVQMQHYNEPFTDKFIFERIKYVKSKGMRVILYSNGTLLDEGIRNSILEVAPDLLRFSVDGFNKDTYESIRIGANYEQVVGSITNLFSERQRTGKKLPKIELYFSVLKENRNEIGEFLKFWKNNCDKVCLFPADSRNSEKFVSYPYKNKKQYPCYNPKNIVVLSNGKVVICCVDIEGDIVLGDLKKEKLNKIINSKKAKDIFCSQLARNCNIKMCKECSKAYIDSVVSWW